MMKLEYQPTLDEITELQWRAHLMSKVYARQRITEPIRGGISLSMFVFIICIVKHPLDFNILDLNPFWMSVFFLSSFGVGFLMIFSIIKSEVRRRIKNNLKLSQQHDMPITVMLQVSENQLHAHSENQVTTLELNQLKGIMEDPKYLEIRFEPRAICVIPQRVFESPVQKARFLSAVGKEPVFESRTA